MLATIRTFARVFFIGLAVAFSGSVAAAQINLANTANLPDDLYGSADDPLHITVGGNEFVFAVASGDFGVMGFSVASNGALTLVSETRQSDTALLGQPYALASAVVDGTTYLFVASRTDDVVNVYSVSDAGALTFVSSVVDNVTVNLDSVTDVAVAEVDGATYLLTVSASDDGVSVFSVAANGALTNVHNVTDSGSLELDGAWGLATAEVGGTDFVFVSGVFDDGVSVFSLAANGTLTSTFDVPDSGSLELDAPWELTTVDVDGTTYLVVSGYNDDGLSVFSVAANGTLTNVHNVADDATLNLNGVREVSAIEIDGTVFLYAAGAIDSGVSVFSVAANGTLTNVSNVSDTDSIALSRANGVDTAMIDGSPFVFVTGETDGGITSFSAANDGSLSNVTTLADNLDIVLDRVYGLALAQIGGNDYLFSAAGNDDAVAVMSIGANGALTQVARAVDDATLNLDEARGVATSAIGGTTFLFAAAATDDGVSVFSVADNGALTNVFNIADSGSLELDGARTLTAANVGGTDLLFVGGYNDNGISVFTIAANGALASASDFPDNGTTSFDSPHSVATAVVDGTTYLFVGGGSYYSGGLSVFSVASNGTLTNVENVSDSGSLNLRGDVSVTTAAIDGTTFLFAAGRLDSGVSVFSVAANGALTNVANLSDSAGRLINTTSGLSVFTYDGSTYLVVAGEWDDGFSVFSVAANGALTPVADIADDSTKLLDNLHAVVSGTIDGMPYIFTGASLDDGISSFTVDNTAPLVASIDRQTPATSPTSDDSVTWRVTFNEQVTDIDASDFTRTGTTGTLSVSNVSSTAWDVTLSGGDMASLNATVTLAFAGGQNITDLAGNALSNITPSGANVTTFEMVNDVVAPRITSIVRNTPASSPTAADSVSWRVTFDEPVQNVSSGDFTISGTTGTLAVNNVSTTVTDVSLSGGDMASLDATVTLGFAGDQNIADLADNALSNTTPTGTTQLSFDIDNTAPVLTAFARNTPTAESTNADTLVFDITFDGSVQNVTADDFTITGTTATGVLAGSGAAYTLTLSGGDLAGLNGTVGLDLAGGQDITDAVGNALAAGEPATDETFTLEHAAPQVASITRQTPAASPTDADSVTWRVTFDEAVNYTPAQAASPFGLSNVANVSDDDDAALELSGAFSATTAVVNSTTYLFVAGFYDDGVSVFSVAGDGTLTNVANVVDSGSLELDGASAVTTAVVDGTTYLFAAGQVDDGISVFSVAGDGTLTNVDNVTDDAALELHWPAAVTTAVVDGSTYLIVAGLLDDGVSVFSVAGDGTLTNTDNMTDDDTLNLNGAWSVTTAVVGGTTYLFAAGYSDSGVSVFSIAANGTLTHVGNVTDDSTLELDGAIAVTTATVNGTTYLFAAGHTDNGVSVFSVAANGTLSHVDNVADDDPLPLIGVRSVTTAVVDDTTYLFVASYYDDGVSVFSVAANGMLTHVANVTDDGSLELDGARSITTAIVNSTTYLFAAGDTDNGVSVFGITPPAATVANFTLAGTTGALTEAVISPTQIDVTASGGDLANLNATITLGFDAGQTFEDLAGNALVDTTPTGANDNTFEILNDAVAPRIASITRQSPATSPTAADSVTWRVTFDEAVANVTADDFTVTGTNGTVSISAVSTSVTDVIVSGGDMASLNGTITLSLAGGQDIADLAGNALSDTSPSGANASTFEIDNSRPTLAITGPSGPVSGAFTATFLFSENVTAFSAGDISVANGTAANVQATSASVYIATITPAADGAVSVNVAAAAQDAAGNNNLTAAQYSVENDETPPTVTAIVRQTPAASPTDADSLVWRVTFAEAVDNIDAGDFTVTGTTATVEAVVDAGGNGVDVTVSGGDLSDLNGTATIGFAAGQDISDLAGNTLAGTTPTGTDESAWSVINDAEAPTVTAITRDNPAEQLTNADTLVWVVVFSEDVTDIDGADFALSGTTGTVTGVSEQAVALPPSANGSAQSQSFAVSSSRLLVTASGGDLANFNGEVALSFAAQQNITDSAGNALASTAPTGANDNIYTLDNTAPTVDLTIGEASPVSGPFTLTATFSEDVAGFDMSDLTVGNGTLSEFATVSPTVYTATITPGSGTNITVDVAAGAAADNAGNDNTAAAQLAIAHDTDRALNIAMPGVGSGTVSSDPAGIDCGSDCSADYTLGATVTLTAIADSGSSFAGWTAGPCNGTSAADCAVTIEVDTTVAARFTLDAPPPGRIVASTLPAARSGYVGGPVITAFLSVVSRTSSPAQSCAVSAPAGAPVTLSYRQIDGSGAATGSENPVFDIASGGALSFVIAMTPTAETAAGGYEFMPVISCENASLDPIVGVNSVFLTIESVPTPDILSISATPSNDGVIRIPAPGATGFMVAAAVNIGAGDGSAGANEITLTTSVDTGDASLPVSAEVCQIDQTTAACITPRGASVTLIAAQNAPVFYAVFVRDTSTGGIAFDPANARVFLRFADASGTIRSATSAAVTAPAPAAEADIASSVPEGRWSVLVRQPEGIWPGLARASLFVMADGIAVIDDGRAVRRLDIAPAQSDTEGRGAFEALQHDGQWSTDGAIRLGAPWADTHGEFWGARDARPARIVDWTAYSGSFGAGVYLTEAGEIRGSVAGCSVYGRAGEGFSTSLTLSGCDDAGVYTAVLDMPANESNAPALLIAGQEEGWRLER